MENLNGCPEKEQIKKPPKIGGLNFLICFNLT